MVIIMNYDEMNYLEKIEYWMEQGMSEEKAAEWIAFNNNEEYDSDILLGR